ncbi:unnamed protein product, partial [Allacma fusca]
RGHDICNLLLSVLVLRGLYRHSILTRCMRTLDWSSYKVIKTLVLVQLILCDLNDILMDLFWQAYSFMLKTSYHLY